MVRMDKKEAQRRLGDAPEDKVFWCRDGQVFRNLYQLRDALEHMSPEVFTYHVDAQHNDFANWIRDVIGDRKLAQALGLSSDPQKSAKRVALRIAWLEQRS